MSRQCLVILISFIMFTGCVKYYQIDEKAESTALKGLLNIVESQKSYAINYDRYANNIDEMGRGGINGNGFINMVDVYDANYDNVDKKSCNGYYFRVVPIFLDSTNNVQKNSFFAAAIPQDGREDLPVFFTFAKDIKKINFPLINWFSIRVYGKNRHDLKKIFGNIETKKGIHLCDIGIQSSRPDNYKNGDVILRFIKNGDIKYNGCNK